MKISIITTSYNSVHYIKHTLDSVISQVGDLEIEYIFQDAVSTDGTWEIIQQFATEYSKDKRIKVLIESAKDGGMYAGINKGLAKMTGDIWGYLNADDILMPGALREVVEYFEKNPQTEMIYGQGLYINEHGDFFGLYPSQDIKKVPLVDNCYISQPSVFLRSNVYKKLGGFNANIKNSGDYEYWLRVQDNNFQIDFIPQVLSATRIHQDTKTLMNRPKIQLEVMAITSHYNKGRVPQAWKEAFTLENNRISKSLDFGSQVFYKLKSIFAGNVSRFFAFRKGKQIKTEQERIFA